MNKKKQTKTKKNMADVIPSEVFLATIGRDVSFTKHDYRLLSTLEKDAAKTIKKIVRFPSGAFLEQVKKAGDVRDLVRIPKGENPEDGFYENPTAVRLGAGGFGTTYAIGEDRVMKFVVTDGMRDISDFVMESLIQIVLWYELCGPSVPVLSYGSRALIPRVYDLFCLPMRTIERFYFVIVMERLDMTLHRYMYNSHVISPTHLDVATSRSCVAAMAIYQVGKTLQQLWETHRFSHGDLSHANVMAKLQDASAGTNSNGLRLPQFYLIDFGTARMVYNGFLLHGASKIPDLHAPENPSPSRDLLFLIFKILTETHCMPEKLDEDRKFIPAPEEFDCPDTFRPELIHEFIRLFRMHGPLIYEKLRTGQYYAMLHQTIRLDTSSPVMLPPDAPPPFEDVMNVAKQFLRSVARPSDVAASEPFFFGRTKRKQQKRMNY